MSSEGSVGLDVQDMFDSPMAGDFAGHQLEVQLVLLTMPNWSLSIDLEFS